jgi:gamma-glutamyl-gamma-aminobutyrate hydrolase PuuD
MAPLIGISTSELRTPPHVEPLAESDPARRELALGLDYPRAVDAAGGIPVVVPPMAASDLDGLLDRVDGLLLSGGPTCTRPTTAASPTTAWARPSRRWTSSSSTCCARPTSATCRSWPSAAACRR